MALSDPQEFLKILQSAVGDDHVHAGSVEDGVDGRAPRWVVEPGSTAELAHVLRLADAAALRIVPRGSGTKIGWGNPPTACDIILSTRRLDRVLEHAAGDMTATVEAGCTVAAFAKILAERGQQLALDPLWPQRATIGGILATNDNGSLRASYGTLRDHLIGITVVLPDGTLAKSGGKVVKNVAGYDLPKLFTGSFGTLGFIVEATFRLYPVARASRSLRFIAATPQTLGKALAALAECSLVTALQFETADEGPIGLLALVEGLPETIEAKVQRVSHVAGDSLQQADLPPDPWAARERLFADADSCVAKISLLPTHWPEFIEQMRHAAGKRGVRWQLVAQSMGVGLLRISPGPCPLDGQGGTAADSSRFTAAIEIVAVLRALLDKTGGSLTLLQCPAEMKRRIDVWPNVGNALALMRRIKEQFDPRSTLSPGRFVGGI